MRKLATIWAIVAWLSTASPALADSFSHALIEKTNDSVAYINSTPDTTSPRSELRDSDLLTHSQPQISWESVAGVTWYEVRDVTEEGSQEKPNFHDRVRYILSKISSLVKNH